MSVMLSMSCDHGIAALICKQCSRYDELDSRALAAEKERDVLRANYESAMKATRDARKEADRWLKLATEWQRQCEEAEAQLRAKPRPVERETVGWVVRLAGDMYAASTTYATTAKADAETYATREDAEQEAKTWRGSVWDPRVVRRTRPKKAEVGK